MTKYTFNEVGAETLADHKTEYTRQLSHPLDGMWMTFMSFGTHYAILNGEKIVGYSIVNQEGMILQFYALKQSAAQDMFEEMLAALPIKGGHVSTFEGMFMSLCLDHHEQVTSSTLLYHWEEEELEPSTPHPKGADFTPLTVDDLDTAVSFGIASIGADPDWLRGYFADLISKRELFGLRQAGELIATGEYRANASRDGVVDLGMIVLPEHRGQSLGTAVLKLLLQHCTEQGLQPICSTESGNMAARKAIEQAGFVAAHRLLTVHFSQG